MKRLIVCETPFQILTAMYLKEQLEKHGDYTYLVVANVFQDYKKIAERIQDHHIFHNVYVADVKNMVSPQNNLEKLQKLIRVLTYRRCTRKIFGTKRIDFDELYCGNYDTVTATLRTCFTKKNKEFKTFMFDEGFISYMPIDDVIPQNHLMRVIAIRNKMIGLGRVTRIHLDGLFLFEPGYLMYRPSSPVYKIDRMTGKNSSIVQDVNSVFDAQSAVKKYDRKYILFEEGFKHFEIDDYAWYEKIIACVGADQVIIKLHPRTKVNRFEKLGVKVLPSDGVPWEAIMLAGQLSDKILIAIGSGSVTNCRLMFGGSLESFLLFRVVDFCIKFFEEKYDPIWDKLGRCEGGGRGGLHIPRSEQEFMKLLIESAKREEL